ncbi:MAG: cupin domain-containing protein [Thermomicrobiales bacterium]
MPASLDDPYPVAPRGRLSRRAIGAFATAGLAAGIAIQGLPARADEPPSSQINADGTTPFNFHLESSAPRTFAGGTIRTASVAEMPRLTGLGMQLVEIAPGSLREVHWHPNASEIGFVLAGAGVMSILSASGDNARFPITVGTSTFVPRGDAHAIENNGDTPLVILIGFSHESPEHLTVSESIPWIPTRVIEQSLGVAAGTLPRFPPRGDLALVPNPAPGATASSVKAADSIYSAALAALPLATFGGGTVQAITTGVVPKLTDMTLLRLVIEVGAVREPHWHGNAGEFNYCVRGSAEVGIVAPSGESWTFTLDVGDVAFIPNNWFHAITNVGAEVVEIVAFFDAVAPSRIDLSTMAGFFPPEVLAASLDVSPDVFTNLPHTGTVVIAPPVPDNDQEGTPTP